MSFIKPFNPARAANETFEEYKSRRASQNASCKTAAKSAGIAWASWEKGTKFGKFSKE